MQYNACMNLDSVISNFKNWLDGVLHSSFFGTAIVVVIILIVTALVAHGITVLIKRVMTSERGQIPQASIFINIGRISVWLIGICVILSSCFGINIGSVITALGIGGIAISLGFQSTLSNLISGIQIIMTGLIEPGDNIQIGTNKGIVHDVTWRHTTIRTARDETVVIPNSVINTEALVKLPPETEIHITLHLNDTDKPLNELVPELEKKIDAAVSKIAVLLTKSQILVTGKIPQGYEGILTFVIGEGTKRSTAIDAAMHAISGEAKRVKDHHDHEGLRLMPLGPAAKKHGTDAGKVSHSDEATSTSKDSKQEKSTAKSANESTDKQEDHSNHE